MGAGDVFLRNSEFVFFLPLVLILGQFVPSREINVTYLISVALRGLIPPLGSKALVYPGYLQSGKHDKCKNQLLSNSTVTYRKFNTVFLYVRLAGLRSLSKTVKLQEKLVVTPFLHMSATYFYVNNVIRKACLFHFYNYKISGFQILNKHELSYLGRGTIE